MRMCPPSSLPCSSKLSIGLFSHEGEEVCIAKQTQGRWGLLGGIGFLRGFDFKIGVVPMIA